MKLSQTQFSNRMIKHHFFKLLSRYLVVLVCLFNLPLSAQTPGEAHDFNLPDVQSISPQIYQQMKYGEYSITEYTGTPNISIPLYTIQDKDITVPIELRYNASGIRVSEEASWTGLGWDIQFGSITQIRNGINDFSPSPVHQMSLPDYIKSTSAYGPIPLYEFNSATYPGPDLPDGEYSSYYFVGNDLPGTSYGSNVLDGNHDSQPDIMLANFFGHSFKFLKDPNTGNIKILDKKGYKVSETTLSENFGWKVTTPDGMIYYFDEVSETCVSSDTYQGDYGSLLESCSYVSATNHICDEFKDGSFIWRISRIESTMGGEVIFNYNTSLYTTLDYTNLLKKNYYEATLVSTDICANGYAVESINSNERRYFPGGSPGSKDTYSSGFRIFSVSETTQRKLASIVFSNGQVDLITSDNRLDYNGAFQLDQLKVVNSANTTIKEFNFNYDYFTAQDGGYGFCQSKSLNEISKRLKLVSLEEEGRLPYVFQYSGLKLPYKNSFAVDHWGYFNGQISNQYSFPDIKRLPPRQLQYTPVIDILETEWSAFPSNHSASDLHAQAGTLKKIFYPTGGYTQFEYELNEFDYDPNDAVYNEQIPYITKDAFDPTQSSSEGFGLRVKSISSYDSDQELSKRKEYTYHGGKPMVPMQLMVDTDHGSRVAYVGNSGGPGSTVAILATVNYQAISTTSTNHVTINSVSGSNHVGYDQVNIQEFDRNAASSGIIERYFHNEPFKGPTRYSMRISPVYTSSGVTNGLLEKEILCKGSNCDGANKVRETVNQYISVKNADFLYGVKTAHIGMYGPCDGNGNITYGSTRASLLFYYPIYAEHSLLDNSQVTYFYPSGDMTYVTNNAYNYFDLIDSQTSGLLNGQLQITTFKYPFNALSGFSTPEQAVLSEMNTKNILSKPVFTQKNYGTSVHQTATAFAINNNEYFPKTFKTNINNSGWVNEVNIDLYDDAGNVRQATSRDGTTTVYLWGYGNDLPIAIIRNSSFNEVSTVLGADLALLEGSGLTNASILQKLDALRSDAQMGDAQVFSMTHKPLIGVEHVVDANGIMTRYEYDEFSRLIKEFDSAGILTSRYLYNFK